MTQTPRETAEQVEAAAPDRSADVFTLLHANIYVNNKRPKDMLDAIRRSGCDAATINEGQKHLTTIREGLGKYDLFYGRGPREEVRGWGDTPILHRKAFAPTLHMSVRACDASEPIKLAPARYFHAIGFRHPALGQIAVVNLHPHAAVMGHPRSVGRVDQYARSMRVLDRMLTFVEEQGYKPIVGGDVQWREQGEGTQAEWSPYAVFKAHKMRVESHNIDAIAVHRSLRIAETRTIDKAKTGSDHDWLLAAIEAA